MSVSNRQQWFNYPVPTDSTGVYLYNLQEEFGTNISRIYVPTDAITAEPTITTIPTPPPFVSTTTVSPTSPVASSSVNVGAIAGAAIGGVILLGLAFAFTWYKIRTHRNPDNTQPAVERYSENGGDDYPEVSPAEKSTNVGFATEGVSQLRYPENIPSGKLGGSN
jgi:hypothetical protein